MKLVLEILSPADDRSVAYKAVETFPLFIGRGYHNDIILNDPHISAAHLRIEHDADGWKVCNLADADIVINTQRRPAGKQALQSGDVIRIGQTEIRFFAPHHPVAAPLPLVKSTPFFLTLARPAAAYLLLVAALAAVTGWSWLEIFEENALRTATLTAAAVFAVVLVWAGVWAGVSRLMRNKSFFMGHLALASLYILLSTLFDVVQSGIDFLSTKSSIASAANYTANMILMVFLVYGSLSLATPMTQKRRLLWAGCFSGGLLAGIFLMSLVDAQDFNDMAEYPTTLKPYLARIAPHQSLEAFMADNEKLFEAKILTALPESADK